MRFLGSLFLLLSIAMMSACKRDDFGTRYEKADAKLKSQAEKIDRDLSAQLKDMETSEKPE